jgi:Polyketide cyclase / dehydrase and lipid transport
MASIRRDIVIAASPDDVWDAMRDFGAVHERVVPGFVVDCRLDGEDRIVTFFSGMVQREPLVACDDDARRLVYAAVDSPFGATHYNASVRVLANGDGGATVEWVVDVLPHELAPAVGASMDRAATAMQQALQARP